MSSIIYRPKGRAQEYAELAANLWTGCPHGCVYCYAPGALRRKREDFHALENIAPRKDVLKQIRNGAADLARSNSRALVHLCFTCDPYPTGVADTVTRDVIGILNGYGIGVIILTKGAGAGADLDMLARNSRNKFGMTLTFTDPEQSTRWEPMAAPPETRLELLRKAKALGITTWASLEPVIDPAQTLAIIEQAADFVDVFKVGRLNHTGTLPEWAQEEVRGIDWRKFRKQAVSLLKRKRKFYYIKKDLQEA